MTRFVSGMLDWIVVQNDFNQIVIQVPLGLRPRRIELEVSNHTK